VLHSYLEAFEEIEVALEEFDARAMAGSMDRTDSELERLVELRHEVGQLRRALTSHREVLLALTKPELGGVKTEDHKERSRSCACASRMSSSPRATAEIRSSARSMSLSRGQSSGRTRS
jgi:Mg2+ and Co2+ transporter CorA